MSSSIGFPMPKSLIVDETTETPTYAKFTAQPLQRGFGHTLGNSLRRVLLSSLDGAAISSVRIDNAKHEFDSLGNVVEDITEIVLNLKCVKLNIHAEGPKTLEIVKDKAGTVTAADIVCDSTANKQIKLFRCIEHDICHFIFLNFVSFVRLRAGDKVIRFLNFVATSCTASGGEHGEHH